MTFTQTDKLKALAIVNIFETSRPFGDYSACVVLNDGAGISYGISQFTHRSGALLDVVEAYLAAGGAVGAAVISEKLPLLRRKTASAINTLAADVKFKNALRAASVTREMKDAQRHVAVERYLMPAARECGRRGFVLPLSLAVVYDSMVHGSYERIAARVGPDTPNSEKAWVLDYLRKRHLWLANIPRLRATVYRTKFFLAQIAVGNWDLKLPLNVNGYALRSLPEVNGGQSAVSGGQPAVGGGQPAVGGGQPAVGGGQPAVGGADGVVLASGKPTTSEILTTAVSKFDSVEHTVSTVARRADSAKSLWTTVAGTAWQAAWAVFGFVAGLPREIWIVVAIIAAALMLFYLYRQLEMGRMREGKS